MRALIDTCIVIDALQAREPFSADAQNIFLAVANKRCVGFLTAKSAADIYYLTHRHTHSDHETRQILHTLFSLFELLDTMGMDNAWRQSIPMVSSSSNRLNNVWRICRAS